MAREGYAMVWAILAILGIRIWLLLGALVGAFASSRHFQRSPGMFVLHDSGLAVTPADEADRSDET